MIRKPRVVRPSWEYIGTSVDRCLSRSCRSHSCRHRLSDMSEEYPFPSDPLEFPELDADCCAGQNEL